MSAPVAPAAMDNLWTPEKVEQQRQKVARTAGIALGVHASSPLSVGAAQTGRSLSVTVTAQQPSKHRNRKVAIDGHVFDSGKEAARYQELKLWEKVGAIRDLRLQVSYDLYGANGERVARYVADFVYWSVELGREVIEDVKSPHTRKLPVYRLKLKLLGAQGISITEV